MSREKQIEGIRSVILRMNVCEMCDEIKCIYDCDRCIATQIYNAGYRKQSEVVREIFEEIEKCTLRKIVMDGEVLYDKTEQFAELKKKYTEEQNDI